MEKTREIKSLKHGGKKLLEGKKNTHLLHIVKLNIFKTLNSMYNKI